MNNTIIESERQSPENSTLRKKILPYSDAWLARYTLIGGILFALGAYFLPIPTFRADTQLIWIWDIFTGRGNSIFDIIGVFLVLIPLVMLWAIKRHALAVSLLSYLTFFMIFETYFIKDNPIANLGSILTPVQSYLAIFVCLWLIISIFIVSTLCRALENNKYPLILQRIFSISLLILLISMLFTKREFLYLPDDKLNWTDILHIPVFVVSAIIYSILAFAQSYRIIPAAIINLMLIGLMGIAIFAAISASISSPYAAMSASINNPYMGSMFLPYMYLRWLVSITGLSILLWCVIANSCIRYTGRNL